MHKQQQRVVNLINGEHNNAKPYNRAIGEGENAARVKTHLGSHGVVVFAEPHRAHIVLDNGHKLEAGWPKVELLTE